MLRQSRTILFCARLSKVASDPRVFCRGPGPTQQTPDGIPHSGPNIGNHDKNRAFFMFYKI